MTQTISDMSRWCSFMYLRSEVKYKLKYPLLLLSLFAGRFPVFAHPISWNFIQVPFFDRNFRNFMAGP
jgi:hypothetical protein